MTWHWGPPILGEDAAAKSADAIRNALEERKPLCRNCFNFYIPHERPFGEMFQCRSILMIPDAEPEPMLCDNCFRAIVESFNRQATNIGTSNSQPTNLVLSLPNQ